MGNLISKFCIKLSQIFCSHDRLKTVFISLQDNCVHFKCIDCQKDIYETYMI